MVFRPNWWGHTYTKQQRHKLDGISPCFQILWVLSAASSRWCFDYPVWVVNWLTESLPMPSPDSLSTTCETWNWVSRILLLIVSGTTKKMRHTVTQAQKPWYRPLPKMTVSYPLNTLLTEGRMITPLHHHKNHLCLKATALVVIILQTAHNEAQLALVQLASTESLDHLLSYRMHPCVVLLRVHG